MTQPNKINQTVCFQYLQLQSVIIFLASTYLVIRTHFSGGGTHRAEFGNLQFRGEKWERWWTEQTYRLGKGWKEWDMVVIVVVVVFFI